jgi:tRNA-dihydrouridine synthase
VDSPEKALEYRNRYGVDGIMIGRAAIGYPWVFREIKHFFATGNHIAPPSTEERVEACRQHLRHSIAWKGEKLGVVEMRRHYTNYFKGFHSIKPYRSRLVTEDSVAALNQILDEILTAYSEFEAV